MRKFCRHLPWLCALVLLLVLGAGCSKAARAKRLLASADQDYEAQRYDSAELKYRGVLRLSYMNLQAIRRTGLIYFAEGRPAQAAPYLNKSFELDPTDLDVQVKLAQTLAQLGNVKAAYSLASQSLEKQATNEEALILLVELAHSPTNAVIVRRKIEKLQAATPDAAVFHLALGWLELQQKQVDEGEVELQKALKLDPKDATANLAMSALSSMRHDQAAAASYIKTAADLSPLRSDTRIKYAEFQVESGARADGQRLVEDLTRQAPDYFPGWISLMHLYFGEREFDKCSEVITKILARDSINYEALMQSGNLSLAKHDGTNAIATFQLVDSAHKNRPEVKVRLAIGYLMNGRRADAVSSLNEALKLDQNYAPATLLSAELDVRGGNSGAAVSLLLPLVQSSPNEAKAHLLLATAYMAQKQPEQALEVYRQMSRVFPNNPEVFRLIGVVYESEGDSAKAREAFEQSLAASPDYLPSVEKITGLDISAKDYDDAEKRLAAVIAKDPKQAEPWLLRGNVYAAAGQTNEAEAAMSKAIELDPNLPGPYLSLATLYLATHQEQQALDRLNSLLSKTNNTTAMFEIGQIHQQASQFEAARDIYEKLISVEPTFAPALNNLAYLYSERLTNSQRALELAERARQSRPDDPFVGDTLGWILWHQGQYSRALGLLQESVDKAPNNAELQMHLGMTYYMMEEEDLARVHLRQALGSADNYPGKEVASQCLALLSIDPATATPAEVDLLEKRAHDYPHDSVPLNRLAAIDELQGQVDKAVDAYQKLIDQNPQDWKAMIKLGRLYSGPLHQTRKALDLAKAAHDLAPNDARAAAMLGELVYASGDYTWALSLLQESAPRLRDQPMVQYDLALAYYTAGRVKEADTAMADAVKAGDSLPTLEQAKQFQSFIAAAKDPTNSAISAAQVQAVLEKDPHYLPALALSGIFLERQGDTAQATKVYEQILSEYPQFTPAMRQLAFIYAQRPADEAKARELGEKARAAFPDDLDLARTLGFLAYRKGDYQHSLLLLRDSSRKFADDGELLYYLGMDYYQLKQRGESKKALQRASALTLPAPMASEAKRVLAELK